MKTSSSIRRHRWSKDGPSRRKPIGLSKWQVGLRHQWAFSLRGRKILGSIFRVYQFDLGVIFSRMWTCAKTNIVNALTAPTDLTIPAPAFRKSISAQLGPSVPVSGVLTSSSPQSCPGTELANVLAWPHISYHHEPARQSGVNPTSPPP